MIKLTKMKRVEILAEDGLVPRLARIVRESGFSGHTVMPVIEGEGSRGHWQEERLTGSTKVMVLAIGTQEDAEALLEALTPMLDSHRLLMTIGEVEVIRQDRF